MLRSAGERGLPHIKKKKNSHKMFVFLVVAEVKKIHNVDLFPGKNVEYKSAQS